MQTFLFPHLMLTQFALPVAGQLRMLCTVTLGFTLDATARLVPPEDVWPAVLASLEEGQAPDLGTPKPMAEWLMAGSACAPAGTSVIGLPVDVRVGELTRSFFVAGDREDDGLSLPHPQPFSRMPLSWTRTFGGPGHPENPFGKGLASNRLPRIWPNLTEAAFAAQPAPPPACPGPRPFTDTRLAGGSFDHTWLRTRWPGVPDDFDWSFYNQSQQAQRQSMPFTGLESVRVTNMHPEHAIIESRLPGKRARAFVRYVSKTSSTQDWQEAQTRLDTVWLFPNALLGLLFWHFSLPAQDERGTDIEELVVAVEEACEAPAAPLVLINAAKPQPESADIPPPPLSEPLVPSPTAVNVPAMAPQAMPVTMPAAMPLAKAPEIPPVTALPPLTAASVTAFIDNQLADSLQELETQLPEINAMLTQQGLEPVEVEALREHLQKQTDLLKKNFADLPPEELAALDETIPVSPETLALKAKSTLLDALENMGLNPKQTQDMLTAVSMIPPSAGSFPNRATYETAVQQFTEHFTALTGAPSSIQEQLKQALLLDGLSPEAFENAVPGLKEALTPLTPEALMRSGLSFDEASSLVKAVQVPMPETMDDMSVLAYMQSVEKAGGWPDGLATDMYASQIGELRNTLYSQIMKPFLNECAQAFPHEGPALEQLAMLGATKARKQVFDLHDLAMEAGVRDAKLLALLQEHDPLPLGVRPAPGDKPPLDASPEPLDEALAEASAVPPPELDTQTEAMLWNPPHDVPSFMQALREQRDMTGLDLSGLNLRGLDVRTIPQADLSGLVLDNADLTDARLDGANLAFTHLTGAVLTNTSFAGAMCAGCSFAGAELNKTVLTEAVCSQTDFTGAHFTDTTLYRADCTAAVFDKAVFERCSLEQSHADTARFYEADIRDTDFSKTSLHSASFENATLQHVNFTEAMLERATFDTCHLEKATFTWACMVNARIYHSIALEADFTHTDLSRSAWLKTCADHGCFHQCTATGAIFEECSFTHSAFTCVTARTARWLLCDLHNADLTRLDLFEGGLRECRLGNANLTGASLYGADLYRIGVNPQTCFTGADLTGTCLTLPEERP